MKQPTLTPEFSKAARRELGLSQKDVIAETGIQSYKLKQWEGRGLAIELVDLRKLTDFYEAQGVNFAELAEHIHRPDRTTAGGKEAPTGAPLQDGYTFNPRPGFFIAADLPAAVVDGLMADMEASDDRIAEIVKAGIQKGVFGNLTESTQVMVQELFGHLAANHLRFRCLQGRNIISATRDEAKTVGEYLGKWVQEKGISNVATEAAETAEEKE